MNKWLVGIIANGIDSLYQIWYIMNGDSGCRFVGSSKDDLRRFPKCVKIDIGHAIRIAQQGGKSGSAKPLAGFGGAGVLEVVESYRNNTYRAVYTVRFKHRVYVLHCFQKKSHHGIETDLQDKQLIAKRLKCAEEDYKNSVSGEYHEK